MALPNGATFATPLPQSKRSSVLEYKFPKPHDQYTLTGRSRAAWHTSFVIPQLNLLLDAGLCVNHLRPKHIFLTHGHSDHTLLSPAFVKREDPPDIYCPEEMEQVFDNFILSATMLNLGGEIQIDDAEAAGLQVNLLEPTSGNVGSARSKNELAWLKTHRTHGLRDGDTVSLVRLKNINVTAFTCDHSVPCLGYLFSQTTQRLRQEYTDLAGEKLRDLRKRGVEITAPFSKPIFAFLGDTTAATLAADPPFLKDEVPIVITECSFLREEHRNVAERTKHTLWANLEPVVRKWPKTTFILMHFSLRYSDVEVARFFRELPNCPPNIVIWVDGEAEDKM